MDTIKTKNIARLVQGFRFREPQTESTGVLPANVAKLRAVAVEAKGEWPFPPVLLGNDVPAYIIRDDKPVMVVEGYEAPKKSDDGTWPPAPRVSHVLVGGYNRITAVEHDSVNIKSVPFTVESMPAVADVVRRGMTDNADHGVLPSKSDVYRAIKRLKAAGIPQKDIADMLGVSKSTVSKVLSNKQGQVTQGKATRKAGGGRKGKGKGKGKGSVAVKWVEAMQALGKVYSENRKAIVAYMTKKAGDEGIDEQTVTAMDYLFTTPDAEAGAGAGEPE